MGEDCRLVVGQRVADTDLIGHLLREGGWEYLLIPMEYDPSRSRVTSIGWKDPRHQIGELMFEPVFTRIEMDKIKGDADTWSTQYQGSPTVGGGGILKAHKWQYWQPAGMCLPPVRVKLPDNTIEERKAVELPDAFDLCLQSWDFAFKDLKTSDFVVGQVVAARGARRFILAQKRDRMDLPASIAAVRELTGMYPRAHTKLIEDKANGPAVIQMLSGEITGMLEVNPEGGKVARAAAVSVELDAGNWYLPHPMIASWVGNPENPTESGFLAECVAFPFGANDDCIDAWSQSGIHIQKQRIGGVFGVSDQDIRVEPMEIGAKWPRLYGLSISWDEIGAIWLTRKPETGEHYLYAEYGVPVSDPNEHAAQILRKGDWIQGAVHALADGRTEKDGYALVGRYRNLRLKLDCIQAVPEAEVLGLSEALVSGKLKVFGNLERFFLQFRQFRRENGVLSSENCGLVKAACVAWAARERARGPAEPAKVDKRMGSEPVNSWMAS
jgi:predicted phage terminase large subunit-like protein